MQKSIIVKDRSAYNENEDGTVELNKLLAEGWTVLRTCPMPSSISLAGKSEWTYKYILPTCLVVLEKSK